MEVGPELSADEVMMAPEEAARHITIWNRTEGRKIAGNAAPLRRNLARYLSRHPECEVYKEQDKLLNAAGGGGGGYIDPVTGERLNEHVPIWHKLERRKVTGNAAPLKKNCVIYLQRHPEYELYNGQDKLPENRAFHAEQNAAAAAAAVAVGAAATSMAHRHYPATAAHPPQHPAAQTLPVPVPGRPTAVTIASAVTGNGPAVPHQIPNSHSTDMLAAHQPATSWTNAPFWPNTANPQPSGSVEASAGIPIPPRQTPSAAHPSSGQSVGMSMGVTPPSLSYFLPGNTPNQTSFPPSFETHFRIPNSTSMTFSKTPAASSFNMTDFSPSRYLVLGTPPARPPPIHAAVPAVAAPAVAATNAVHNAHQEGLAANAMQVDMEH